MYVLITFAFIMFPFQEDSSIVLLAFFLVLPPSKAFQIVVMGLGQCEDADGPGATDPWNWTLVILTSKTANTPTSSTPT